LPDNSASDRSIFQQIAAFLPEKADYRIRNCSISFTNGESKFQIDNMNVNAFGEENNILLSVKFDLELRHSGFLNRTIIIKTSIVIDGEYLPEAEELNAQFVFSSLSCAEQLSGTRPETFFRPASPGRNELNPLFIINTMTIGLTYKDKTIDLKAPASKIHLDYHFSYNTETGFLFANIDLYNFLPAAHINLSENWKNIYYFFNIETTGNLSFKHENDGEPEYSIFLHSGNPVTSWQDGYSLSDAFLININGSRERIIVNNLLVNASDNAAKSGFFSGLVNYSGSIGLSPFAPNGIVSAEQLSFTGKERINFVLDIYSHGSDIQISGDRFSVGSFLLRSIDMNFYPSAGDFNITLSAFCEDNGAVFVDTVLSKDLSQIEASVVFDSFSIANLARIFLPFTGILDFPFAANTFMRNTLLDTEIFFSSNFNNIAYNAPGIVFTNEEVHGILSVSGTDNQFSLNRGIINIGKEELSVSAHANFSNPRYFDFFLFANYMDVAWNIEGQIIDKTTLIIRDPNGLNVFGSISSSGSLSGFLEGVDFPVPASMHPIYTNFYMTLHYDSLDFWSANITHFRFRDLYSRNGTINFSFSGAADHNGASFRNILYNDNIGVMAGSADFSWSNNFSHLQAVINVTDGYENGEYISLDAVLRNKQLNIKTSAENMHINRFIKNNSTMLASGNAEISWNSINSFNTHVNLKTFKAQMQNNAVEASGELNLNNDELLLQDLVIDFAGVKAVFPVFRLSHKEGTAKISADIRGDARMNMADRRVEGLIDLNAEFDPVDSWLNINQVFNSFYGSLQIDNILYGDLSQDRMVFIFSGDDDSISVSGGIGNMLKIEMDRKNNFYAGLFAPLPIRGSFAGTIEKGNFDAHSNDFFIDMASLWKLVNNNDENFNINGGYITGRMNLRGPILNPEFYGTGRGTALSFQVPNYVSEDIRPVPFNIAAEGDEMTFGPVVTAIGKGGGTVSGWFQFENWAPRNIGLDINIHRENPIPYIINVAGFHSNGDASGKIEIILDTNERLLEIRGDLLMNNTEMGINMDEITGSREASSQAGIMNTLVRMSLTTGSKVEFFWPNINSPILRANPEMGTVFLISFDSESAQFSLESDVKIRAGELHYLDRIFYIRQGNLYFNENETRFNPILTARAEIRDRSETGPVTISMIIENQPLLSFVPRFEAVPSLTQLEIYSILGQNLHNVGGGDNADLAQRFLLTSSTDIIAQFASGSDVLAQIIYLRRFERTLRNFLNLDMLSIRTRFFQNAVISGANEILQVSPDRTNRIGNYFDNTTVFMGKYVGQNMFVQGTFKMRYDESNLNFGGLRFEPDIGIEMQSPYFSIRWSFFPYHPENWWVSDNSITLFWSKSF
jgi:hypothetical protein